MDPREIARMFKALGDPTRLHIFQFLRSYCCATVGDDGNVRGFDGPTITEVCGHILGDTKITTSMSFHLKELKNAGLIETEKRGKFVCCSVNRAALASLSTFLHDGPMARRECC